MTFLLNTDGTVSGAHIAVKVYSGTAKGIATASFYFNPISVEEALRLTPQQVIEKDKRENQMRPTYVSEITVLYDNLIEVAE